MRSARQILFACGVVMPLGLVGAQASEPVHVTETACVLDGAVITLSGFVLSIRSAGEKPTRLDLSAYNGQKIELEGMLAPGDVFYTSPAAVKAVDVCSAAQKLKLVPTLVRLYRAQADAQAGATPQAQTAPAARATTPPLDCAAAPSDACYELVRVPKQGGVPTVLRHAAPGKSLIGHVFADAKYVYWSEGESSDWQMMRMSKTTGSIRAISRGSYRVPLRRASEGFYGIFNDKLTLLPDDKPARVLATKTVGTGLAQLALGPSDVYWTESGPANTSFLWRMPRAGGAAQLLASSLHAASEPTVHEGEIFWSNFGGPQAGDSQIMGMPSRGGTPTLLVEARLPWALAADQHSLYWVEWRSGASFELYRAPVLGGAPLRLGSAGEDAMLRDHRDQVELDDSHVYWNARTSLARVPKIGGRAEEVVRLARGDVMNFALDDHYIYLTVVIFGSS